MAHAVPESAHRQRTPKQDKGGKSEKVQNHPTFCAQRLELHPHCIHMKRWTARTLRYILKFEKVKVARTTVKEVVLFHSFCGSKVGKGFRQGGVSPPVPKIFLQNTGAPVHARSANLPWGGHGDCHVTAAACVFP